MSDALLSEGDLTNIFKLSDGMLEYELVQESASFREEALQFCCVFAFIIEVCHTLHSGNNFGLNWKFVHGQAESFFSCGFVDTVHFEHDCTSTNWGHVIIDGTFSFTHRSFRTVV